MNKNKPVVNLLFPVILLSVLTITTLLAGNSLRNPEFIRQLYRDSDYLKKRAMVSKSFEHTVPATLFVTGKWIDKNLKSFLQLSRDTLFEIENHGFNHQPCAIDGESAYGIKGTSDVPDAFDEIEANELKIKLLTGRRPVFYRSATAFIDEAGVRIAQRLGVTVVSFDVLSGDAVPGTPTHEIEKNVLENIRPGAIVIMHFNRPEWNTAEALAKIIPALRKQGYTFARLKDFPLKRKFSAVSLHKNPNSGTN